MKSIYEFVPCIDNDCERSYSITSHGKTRYTETSCNSRKSYSTEIKIEKLDADLLDYQNEDDVRDVLELLDIDLTRDCIYDSIRTVLTFFDNGKRVRINFFTDGEFQCDKMILVDDTNGNHNVTGLIVDFKRDDDFTEAYTEGVFCDMPSTIKYYEAMAKEGHDYSGFVDNKWFDEYVNEDEIIKLLETFAQKVSAGAELIPQGLYVIVNNRIYYLKADEYNAIYHSISILEKLCYKPGLGQLRANLLGDRKSVLSSISKIIKSNCLVNKKYLDLNSLSSIGTDCDTFIEKLLTNDQETYEFLSKELKPVEDVK